MQHVHVLGAIHALALLTLTWRSAGRLTSPLLPRLAALYLLAWCNLVLTGLMLSLLSRLNRVGLYLAVSLAIAALLDIALRYRVVAPHAMRWPEIGVERTPVDRVVRGVLSGTLALAAIASAIICLAYVPNNWDSATYRFSRAFFYLAQGNLLHTGSLDARMSFYPLNGALLYVFTALYQVPAQVMSLVTYVAWVYTALGVYMAARSWRASRTGGLVAAWACCMSPSILAQATATTDELLAAIPMLLGLVFGREFWISGRRRYALLAAIGTGLGLGTKLHWVFYSVFLVAAAVAIATHALRDRAFGSTLARRLPVLVAAGVLAASLSIPFMVSNYVSSGQITHMVYNRLVLNQPFNVSLALEKIRVSTAEMFLSPIPDLVPPIDREQRQAAYLAFNRFFMNCCFSDLVETVKPPYPGGYFFQGPANPEGFLFYEYTWLGFLPHLLLLVGVTYFLARGFPLASMALVASFFCWHFTSAMQTRYQAGQVGSYYSYAAVLAAAALGPAWDFARTSRGVAGRVLMTCFTIVFVTHMVLAYNLLQYGGLRNLQFLWNRQEPPDAHAVDPPVVEAIRAARNIYIPSTRWELLYWNLMRFNPGARYTTGGELVLPSRDTLMLLSITPRVDGGLLAARLPRGSGPGLTYLGRGDGDHMFAQGNGVAGRFPDRSRHVLLRFAWRRDPASGALEGVESLACCVGIGPDEGVEVRHGLLSRATGTYIWREWSRPGQPSGRLALPPDDRYDRLAIETRSLKHPEEIVRTVYDLGHDYYEIREAEERQAVGA